MSIPRERTGSRNYQKFNILDLKTNFEERSKTSQKYFLRGDNPKTSFKKKRKSVENVEYLIPKQIYQMKIMSEVKQKLRPQFSKIEKFALFNSKIGEPIFINNDSRKIFDEKLIQNKCLFYPRNSVSTKDKFLINLETPILKSIRENKTECVKKRNYFFQNSNRKSIDNIYSINNIIKKCKKLENGTDRASSKLIQQRGKFEEKLLKTQSTLKILNSKKVSITKINKHLKSSKGEFIEFLRDFKQVQLNEKVNKDEYDYFKELRDQYNQNIRKYSYNSMIYSFKKKQDLKRIRTKSGKNLIFQTYADRFIHENCPMFSEKKLSPN